MAAEFWTDTDAEGYRAYPALSQSGLKLYLLDPQEYFRQYVARTSPRKPATASQEFGNAVERLAFYGTLDATVIPQDVLNADGHRKGAAYTAWMRDAEAAHPPGTKFFKADEFETKIGPIMQAVDNLRSHAEAAKLIWGDSIKHVRIRWVDQFTGMECKCEIDLLHLSGLIGDLKTAVSVTRSGFQRAVVNFGYYIQSFMYREALQAVANTLDQQPDSEMLRSCRHLLEQVADGLPLLCCWIAVKNKPSYHAEVYPVDDEWYPIAALMVRQAMAEIEAAHRTGVWQTRTHGMIAPLGVPKWAGNALEEMSVEE